MIKVVNSEKPSLPKTYFKMDSRCTPIDVNKLLVEFWPAATTENSLNYFAGEILREPKNLRLHIQRVFFVLAQAASDQAELASAVADLFIVLKQNGETLKNRVLGLTRKHLADDCWIYLKRNKSTGLTANIAITQNSSCFSKSLLSGGLIGYSELIIKSDKEKPARKYNLHEQALISIEYGQLDVALNLLEEAYKVDSENESVSHDLLFVYKALGMQEEYESLNNILERNIS